MEEQYVAQSLVEHSDRKFRFVDRTRSICLRLPGQAESQVTGCLLSTVGGEPFAPGFHGPVVVERLLSDLNLSAGDQFTYWYGGDIGTAEVLGPLFEQPAAPTAAELRVWADSDAMQPMQDWDLLIWDNDDHAGTFLELAAAGACRNHQFFLHLLYGRVGDAVRSGRVDPSVLGLVGAASETGDNGLTTFARRAADLLADPSTFDYAEWCEGGLSRASE